MKKIKIAIIEDEAIIAENLYDVLQDLGYEVFEPVATYSDALQQLEDELPDLLLIDIHLAGRKDGIDLALKINELYMLPFIFLTSNSDKATVERAKQAKPNAYLVKPFNKDEIYTSIEIALFNHYAQEKPSHRKDSIIVKHKHLFIKIKLEDILFLKSDQNYIEIYTTSDEKFLVRDTLNKYIEHLNEKFVRVHRRFVANVNFVQSISNETIMIQNHEIPLAKNYKKDLLDLI